MRLLAFLLGVREFRLGVTARYDDDDLAYWYEWGREWAHRLTFRRWDA